MSVKKAMVVTISVILGFIAIAVGIGSVDADEKNAVSEDGYGISGRIQ